MTRQQRPALHGDDTARVGAPAVMDADDLAALLDAVGLAGRTWTLLRTIAINPSTGASIDGDFNPVFELLGIEDDADRLCIGPLGITAYANTEPCAYTFIADQW